MVLTRRGGETYIGLHQAHLRRTWSCRRHVPRSRVMVPISPLKAPTVRILDARCENAASRAFRSVRNALAAAIG